MTRPVAVVVSAAVPFPPMGGGHLRSFHLTRALAEQYRVTLVGFTYGEPLHAPPFALDIVAVPWEAPPLYRAMTSDDAVAAERATHTLAYDIEEPWFVSYYESERFAGAVTEATKQADLVLFEGTDMGRFLSAVPPGPTTVLDLMDLETLVRARLHGENSLEARRTLHFERQIAQGVNLCLAVSEAEAQAARRLLAVTDVVVVPNGVDTRRLARLPEPPNDDRLLFVGSMNYAPNVDAIVYFVDEVLPQIAAACPTVRLDIVGRDPAPDVLARASNRVHVYGAVPDVALYYREARVVIAPIRFGGGTRLKILEAAALGRPIVATTFAATGLMLADRREILFADTPSAFADRTIELLTDPALGRSLASAARSAALAFDWECVARKMLLALAPHGGHSSPTRMP